MSRLTLSKMLEQNVLSAGQIIDGKYKVIRSLGMGAAGTVYEVEREQTGERFALKAFTPRKGDLLLLKKKFLAEARVLAKLDAPNIVKVYDSGIDETTKLPYFVMDEVVYKDNQPHTLEDVDTSDLDESFIRMWFEDLAGALDYIHNMGVVHRDVKPSNILVAADGHAVLADFGVSRVSDKGLRAELSIDATMATDATTLSRIVFGTANYLAPEVRRGDAATPAADIYALGVTLFRLLTGVWYEPDTRALELLKPFDPVWRRIFPALLATDPRRRSLPPCRRARRPWVWAVLAVAVIAVAMVCARHFLHSGKVRVVSVREGVVSVKEGAVSDKEVVAPGKKDIPSEKGGGATERSIDSIFFVP